MYTTMSFDEMNLTEKLDELSDMLTDACFEVECINYHKMTLEQKEQVKVEFFSALKSGNFEITNEIINAAESAFVRSPMASLLREYKYYTQGEFKQATEQLTEGRKVTIIKFSDFGFPVVFNTLIQNTIVEPYAQHRESLKIIHKPKRKRSLYSNRILPKESLLIYDGWLDIDVDNLTNNVVSKNEHMTVKRSKYHSFDKQFMQNALSSIKGNLIVKLNA